MPTVRSWRTSRVFMSSMSQAAEVKTPHAPVVVIISVVVVGSGVVPVPVVGAAVCVVAGLEVVGVPKQSSTSAPVAGPEIHPSQDS